VIAEDLVAQKAIELVADSPKRSPKRRPTSARPRSTTLPRKLRTPRKSSPRRGGETGGQTWTPGDE